MSCARVDIDASYLLRVHMYLGASRGYDGLYLSVHVSVCVCVCVCAQVGGSIPRRHSGSCYQWGWCVGCDMWGVFTSTGLLAHT